MSSRTTPTTAETSTVRTLTTTGQVDELRYELRADVPVAAERRPIDVRLTITAYPGTDGDDPIAVTPPEWVDAAERTMWPDAGERPTFELTVRDGPTACGSVTVWAAQQPHEIPLAAATPLRCIANLLYERTGGPVYDSVSELKGFVASRAKDVPGRICGLCEVSVEPAELPVVLERICAVDAEIGHALFRRRYDFFATRLGAEAASGACLLDSHDTLVELTAAYTAQEHLGDVEWSHVVGEYLARTDDDHPRERLQALGVTPAALLDSEAGLAYWLATAAAEDVEDARRSIRGTLTATGDSLTVAKRRAENAAPRDRPAAWERVLPAAARADTADFEYTLGNYLYWTAFESSTYGRGVVRLFRVAESLFESAGCAPMAHNAAFEALHTEGHDRRHLGEFEAAARCFDDAVDLAAEIDRPDPTVRATTSLTSVRGRMALEDEDPRQAIVRYEQGIRALHGTVDDVTAWTDWQVLDAKRHEAAAQLDVDEETGQNALQHALEQYEAAEKSRAATRCRDKLGLPAA